MVVEGKRSLDSSISYLWVQWTNTWFSRDIIIGLPLQMSSVSCLQDNRLRHSGITTCEMNTFCIENTLKATLSILSLNLKLFIENILLILEFYSLCFDMLPTTFLPAQLSISFFIFFSMLKPVFLLKILNVFCFLSFLKSPLLSVKIAAWGKPIFSVKTLQSQWRGSFTAVPPVGGMVSLPSCEMLLFLIH